MTRSPEGPCRSGSVLVTGTSSGLGRALLEHYAALGVRVIAVNRRPLPELEARYPAVRFECVDVRSAEDVARLLRGLDELPEVFVLNAGINSIDNDESFDAGAYKTVVDTNLYGVLNFVQPLTELPPGPVARHLVAISSMVTYAGNPHALGYAASKSALTACFGTWSEMYNGTDLVFQQVVLGPVRTQIFTMSDKLPAWMTRLKNVAAVSPEEAARAVARFALTRRARLVYPRRAEPLFLGLKLGRALVPSFFRGRRTLDGKVRRVPAGAAREGSPRRLP